MYLKILKFIPITFLLFVFLVPQSYFAQTTFSFSVDVRDGWNMVSVPGINPAGMGVLTWWPNLTGAVFLFNGIQYQDVTTNPTIPGVGYWMNNGGGGTYIYSNIAAVTHDPIPARAGWNFIGGYETSVLVSAITTDPPTQIIQVWEFNGVQYEDATTLEPGYSYWIRVLSNCDIIIP